MDKKMLERIVEFRKQLHQYPEVSYKEFETHKRLKNMLLELGVKEEAIRQIRKEGQEPTGMIVDLKGQAEPKGKDYCVAFRADMDALSMLELNEDLPYKSKNVGAAHMCGHDGHMACLIGFTALYVPKLSATPRNKTIRLLFQPSEQGPLHGAELMIEKGCLQGVNEVYGFHNWPVGRLGDIWCKEGAVMSQISILKIVIVGDGGHGSTPEGLKIAVWKAVDFYTKIQEYIAKLKEQKRTFSCTFPVLQAGERFNVISESATIQGSLRTYDTQTRDLVLSKIRALLDGIKSQGFKVQYKEIVSCRNDNTKEEAEHVLRVAKKYLGEDRAGVGDLPFRASEDFGFYTQLRPGAFFFFCTKVAENQPMLHNAKFNFKDEIIESAAGFWSQLAEDRLGSC